MIKTKTAVVGGGGGGGVEKVEFATGQSISKLPSPFLLPVTHLQTTKPTEWDSFQRELKRNIHCKVRIRELIKLIYSFVWMGFFCVCEYERGQLRVVDNIKSKDNAIGY